MSYITTAKIYDYEENTRIFKALKERYPFGTYATSGKSVCNRELYSLNLGNYKNVVLFAGGFHGQEWMTCLVLCKFYERLCEAIKRKKKLSGIDIEKALMKRGICIIPCVNPDGVEIAIHGKSGAKDYAEFVNEIARGDFSTWNANAKGVDINHNFNAGWEILRTMESEMGILGPSPRQYGGFAPESEPETRALVSFCEKNNVDHSFAMHSQGEEIYWKYGKNTPENSYTMAKIFSVSSGYTLIENDGLASHGGFKDWFINYYNKSSFTIEIGKGKNPLPLEAFDEIYNKIEEMLVLGIIV